MNINYTYITIECIDKTIINILSDETWKAKPRKELQLAFMMEKILTLLCLKNL